MFFDVMMYSLVFILYENLSQKLNDKNNGKAVYRYIAVYRHMSQRNRSDVLKLFLLRSMISY